MAFDHELEAMAAQIDAQAQSTRLAKLQRRIKLWWRREAILSYRRLFVGEDGRVTVDGARVLADIAGIARLGIADLAAATDSELRERAGRRSLALHIIGRCDLNGEGLRDISTKLRRLESE